MKKTETKLSIESFCFEHNFATDDVRKMAKDSNETPLKVVDLFTKWEKWTVKSAKEIEQKRKDKRNDDIEAYELTLFCSRCNVSMEEIQKMAIVFNTLLLKVEELFEKCNTRSEQHAGRIRKKQFEDLNNGYKTGRAYRRLCRK